MTDRARPQTPLPEPLPASIAIAGAWGYIGRKFLDVALDRGLTTYVLDPGPIPADIDPERVIRVDDEKAFHSLDVDLYHLAVHPEYRRLDLLLGRDEPLVILNEKPMAEPQHPDDCRRIVEAVAGSSAIVLYDFPELFDPLTQRIIDYLSQFRDVHLTEFIVLRSKDREDPANPRNAKRMVPIAYQESVHCLAFVLHLVASLAGSPTAALASGLRLRAEATPYDPMNPDAYPYVVDGRCAYVGTIGDVRIEGCTDFKRHAEWDKRRIIRGVGDGRPFEVDVSYLEGRKWLRIDGQEQPCDPSANSYEHVLATTWRWVDRQDRSSLMGGLFPNPAFTRLTYQLSAALWRSGRDREELAFRSADDLLSWDARFAEELPRLPRYQSS